jgi:hypothetical protein
MLKKHLRAAFVLAGLLLILAFEITSLEHITDDICSKGSNPEHEDCATYNLVAVWFWHIEEALDHASAAITAVATGFIAWFTFTLWGATREHSQIHERLTTLTEQQTSIAERAMTRADWPYIILKKHAFRTPISRGAASFPPSVEYTLGLHGKTPIILRAVYDAVVFAESIPRIPDSKPGWVYIDEICYAGDSREDEAQWDGDVQDTVCREEMDGQRRTKKVYFLIGRWVYDDVFENQHEFGFCYQCGRLGGRGTPYGGAAYNYRRVRKPEERI